MDFSNYEQILDCGIPEVTNDLSLDMPIPPKKQRISQPEKATTRTALRISMSKLGNRSVRLLAEYKDKKFHQFLIEISEVGPYSATRTEVRQAGSRRRSFDYFEAASQFANTRNEIFPACPYGKEKFLASHIDIF